VNRGHYVTQRDGSRVLPPETLTERVEAIWQRALLGWTGVANAQGDPLACTPEAKREFGLQFPDTRTALLLAAQSDPDVAALEAVRPT
jgi:hypothetical protein